MLWSLATGQPAHDYVLAQVQAGALEREAAENTWCLGSGLREGKGEGGERAGEKPATPWAGGGAVTDLDRGEHLARHGVWRGR